MQSHTVFVERGGTQHAMGSWKDLFGKEVGKNYAERYAHMSILARQELRFDP